MSSGFELYSHWVPLINYNKRNNTTNTTQLAVPAERP